MCLLIRQIAVGFGRDRRADVPADVHRQPPHRHRLRSPDVQQSRLRNHHFQRLLQRRKQEHPGQQIRSHPKPICPVRPSRRHRHRRRLPFCRLVLFLRGRRGDDRHDRGLGRDLDRLSDPGHRPDLVLDRRPDPDHRLDVHDLHGRDEALHRERRGAQAGQFREPAVADPSRSRIRLRALPGQAERSRGRGEHQPAGERLRPRRLRPHLRRLRRQLHPSLHLSRSRSFRHHRLRLLRRLRRGHHLQET